jgi:hypothetical protein
MSITLKFNDDILLTDTCTYVIFENGKPLIAASCKQDALSFIRSIAATRIAELEKDPRVPAGKMCVKCEETYPDFELTVSKQEVGRLYNGIKRNVSVISYTPLVIGALNPDSKHCPINTIIHDCNSKMVDFE